MRINWKLRLQNRQTLVSLIALTVAIVYQILSWVGVIPPMEESDVIETCTLVLELLAGIGILIDPTTQGKNDSERAMRYTMPNKPELPDNYFEAEPEEGSEDDGE